MPLDSISEKMDEIEEAFLLDFTLILKIKFVIEGDCMDVNTQLSIR